jgi:TolA-binding protein
MKKLTIYLFLAFTLAGTTLVYSQEANMEEDGMSVSEMNVKLLQKVEELTLYLIRQDDKLQKQETTIEELKTKINEMERR